MDLRIGFTTEVGFGMTPKRTDGDSSTEPNSDYIRIESITSEILVVHVGLCTLTEHINLERFGRMLYALVEQQGCRKMVVNLDAVRQVSAAALGKLIVLHRKMHRRQGRLLFCHVHAPVADILRASHLINYLQIVPDVDAALATIPRT